MFLFISLQPPAARREPPLPHVALRDGQYIVHHPASGVYLCLQERNAYPGTYCHIDAQGTIYCGYGQQASEDEEFLHIEIRGGAIQIKRDLYCTLPLFYGQGDSTFVLCNTYHEVCTRLPRLTINPSGLRSNITMTAMHTESLWHEIDIVGEREVLRGNCQKIIKHLPPPRPWQYNHELHPTDPRDFPAVLEAAFERCMTTQLVPGRSSCEISGGLDSAIMPLYDSLHGHALRIGVSKILPKPYTAQQTAKLEAIAHHATLPIFPFPLEVTTDHPLAPCMYPTQDGRQSLRPFYCMSGLYEAATRRMARYMQEHGIQVVATGSGGDELFEHHAAPSPELESALPTPNMPFWTSKTRPARLAPTQPATRLSVHVLLGALGHNNSYIDYDIWPVSPYHNLALYEFCQALPLQFRSNKNILRLYAAARHFPINIYHGPNESFSTFFNSCVRSPRFATLLAQLAQKPLTGQLGYIAKEKLLDAQQHMQEPDADHSLLFRLYSWAVVELNLQMAIASGQLKRPALGGPLA